MYILENTSYIYLKIQTYAKHSSRVMAHGGELVPLGNKNTQTRPKIA